MTLRTDFEKLFVTGGPHTVFDLYRFVGGRWRFCYRGTKEQLLQAPLPPLAVYRALTPPLTTNYAGRVVYANPRPSFGGT